MTGSIRAGVRRLFRLAIRDRGASHAEVDEELRFHLEARTEQLVRQGLTPRAARAEAVRRLGASLGATRRHLHRSADRKDRIMAFRESFENLVGDIRYAVRGLAQRPGFTAVAVLTLAVGIGANTAIFSAVDTVLLRALPYRDPGRLVDVTLHTSAPRDEPWSWPKFTWFRDRQQSYSSVALDVSNQVILSGADPERVTIEAVTAPFLATLGLPVALGHDFTPEQDDGPAAPKRALISAALWQRRFHADPHVVGALLRIDNSAYEVIGVLPPGFRGLSGQAEALIPIASRVAEDLSGPWSLEFSLIGRLKPGVSIGQAEAEARALGRGVYEAYPFAKGMLTTAGAETWDARARPLDTIRTAPVVRQSLLILFGAVGMVLLIACVNLANLLLGRAASRRQEIAVRLAIGAGRGRLVRLLITESVLLAIAGGTIGILVAWGATHVLQTINPADALSAQGIAGNTGGAGFDQIHLDGRALAFTFGVALTVGLLFGLIPALHGSRAELTDSLKDGSAAAGGTGLRLGVTRRALVVAEVALALVLLAGAGLMLRSLDRLMRVDPGFDPGDVLTLRLAIPPGTVPPDSLAGFYPRVEQALAAVPGVAQVGLADCPPVSGGCNGTIMTFPDRPQSATSNAMVGVHWVSPQWFRTLRVPLRRGRLFDAGDRNGAPRVVLINETAARRYFPGEDPIGRPVKVYQGGFDAGATVVGIVGDVRFGTLDSAAAPDVYISTGQAHVTNLVAFLRTSVDPASVAASARRALKAAAPLYPVYDVQTMEARLGTAASQPRVSSILLTVFAGLALGLALLGIYGVMAFGVAQRTREIGIRMALGADRSRVLAMILREGAMLAAIGVAVGLACALVFTRVLRATLYDVRPSDPPTYVAIVAVLTVAVLMATWIPARRAAGIDPTEALRRS